MYSYKFIKGGCKHMTTNWQDPISKSSVPSTHMTGIHDALKKLELSVDLPAINVNNVELTEIPITDKDRYRIYQSSKGTRNWVSTPLPVIKKNGVVITDGFTIDYGGGAIILDLPANANDVFTANFTHTARNDIGEAVDEIYNLFNNHLIDETPHQIIDNVTNKVYNLGFQKSADGNPQIILKGEL